MLKIFLPAERNSMRNSLKHHHQPESSLNIPIWILTRLSGTMEEENAQNSHQYSLPRLSCYRALLLKLALRPNSLTFLTILKKFQNSFVRKLKTLNAMKLFCSTINDFVLTLDCSNKDFRVESQFLAGYKRTQWNLSKFRQLIYQQPKEFELKTVKGLFKNFGRFWKNIIEKFRDRFVLDCNKLKNINTIWLRDPSWFGLSRD